MKKSKMLISALALSVLGLGFIASPSTYAVKTICEKCADEANGIPADVCAANGCSGYGGQVNDFQDTLSGILNGIIAAMSIVAVIFIIIGGVYYMTSAGDAGKVKKGRDTILYALIGLIVCALSYAIVNWVILKAL